MRENLDLGKIITANCEWGTVYSPHVARRGLTTIDTQLMTWLPALAMGGVMVSCVLALHRQYGGSGDLSLGNHHHQYIEPRWGSPPHLAHTHTHWYSCLYLIILLPTDKHQDPRWSSLPLPLLEMLLSGRFEGHVEENTKKVSHHCVSDDRRDCCFIVHISPSLTGANLSAVPSSEQDPDECEQLQRKWSTTRVWGY